MPKMKSKSSAKKRFSFTATGKVKRGFAGKRHNLDNRSTDMKRTNRGTAVMSEHNAPYVRKHLLPYGGR